MVDAYHILKYAVKNGSTKLVILDIDYQYLINRHDESILFHQVYNGYPLCGQKVSYFIDRIAKEEYRGAFLKWTYEGKGFISKSKKASKATTSVLEWDESKVSDSECEYIEKIVNLCRKNDIKIIFTTVVQDPGTVTGQADRFAAADSYIRNLANKLNVEYYNFNYLTFEAFDRTEEDFWDREGHMYGETAEKFSAVYAQVISKSLDGTLINEDYFGENLKEIYQGIKSY